MPETRRVTSADFNLTPAPDVTQGSIRVRTAREICEAPEPEQTDLLLGPLVVRGARTIIVGDTGHGKTTLALQLAAAVLGGRDALGYTGAGVGPVLVVDLEQGERSIRRILNANLLNDRDDVLYAAVPDGLELDASAAHRSELERIIINHAPAVLILDPYYKAHRADSNEERGVVDLMRHLDELRSAYGFSLILPAHPRKEHPSNISAGGRKLSLSDVFGSGAITRGAELVVAIERVNHGYARLRYLKDRDHDLPVGDFLPLLYDKERGYTIHDKEVEDEERTEEQLLASDHEWRTVKDWAAHLSVRESTARKMLERLAAEERINFMVGPPGRSPKAQCYSTSPISWEQSGAVGSSPNISVTAPTAPDSSIGSSDDGSSSNGSTTTPTAPGAVDPRRAWLDDKETF